MKNYEQKLSRPMSPDKEVKKWIERLDRAIEKRKPFAKMWASHEEYVSLKRLEDAVEGQDLCAVNKTRAFINNRVASFVYKNPRFIVRPVNQNGFEPLQVGDKVVPRHQVAEHLLNFVVSQPAFGADRTARRLARSGLCNIGVVKVGYDAEYGNGLETDELYAYDDQGRSWLRDPSMPADADERGVPKNLVQVHTAEYGKSWPLSPTSERWFCDWVRADRMLYDPDGENEFYDHEWVACEYYWPLEDIKKNPRFNKQVAKEVKGTIKPKGTENADAESYKYNPHSKETGEDNYGRIFEIFDIRNRKVIWYADGGSKFLATEDYPLGVTHSPYVHFITDENDGEWYPHSILTDLIPINQEIDKLRLLDLHGAYGNTPKWGYLAGDIDDDQLENLMSPVPNETVRFNKFSHGDPKRSLFAIDRQYTPPDFYARLNRLEMDFDEIAGQSSEVRGRASSRLATGINQISQANREREDDFRERFAACYREIGKKLLDSLQANMDAPTAIAIDGPDGEAFVATITADMISGDFDVSVDVEDMMPRSTDVETANLIQLANLFGQYPLMGVDERVSGPLLEKMHVNSALLREGLRSMAEKHLQIQTGANLPDAQGGKAPPQDMGMLAAQMGGGM